MNRLQAELQRLYLPREAGQGEEGGVRAAVLEVDGPNAWEHLAPAWQGVQADWQLPAPGIAVSGSGYQLWFSLVRAVPPERALAFLRALRARYLPEAPTERVRTSPREAGAAEISGMPPGERGEDRWAAFVAADLAALFVHEPWLDLPPGNDAQAELLSRLQSIGPGDLDRALSQAEAGAAATGTPRQDPRSFLLCVMNDPAVDLHLRIEAARALLPWFEGQRPSAG